MKKLKVLTCADVKFVRAQQRIISLINSFSKERLQIDQRHVRLDIEFVQSDFYRENIRISSIEKLFGYCIWKPFYILECLETLQDNELLLYVDCSDYFSESTLVFVCKELENQDIFAWHQGIDRNKIGVCTRRECMVTMNSDNEETRHAQMIEAGFLAIRKTQKALEIIKEWLHYCTHPECVVDESLDGKIENYPEYKFHRHDQSVLSILFHKYGLTKLKEIPTLFLNSQGENKVKYFIDCGTHYFEGLKTFEKMYGFNNEWHVYSFEANPFTFEDSKSKKPQHQYTLTHENKAVWINAESITVRCEGSNQKGCASTVIKDPPSVDTQWKSKFNWKSEENVLSVRLSDLIFQLSKTSEKIVVKMDIEGAEFEVLEDVILSGAACLIDDIYIEFHERFFIEKEEH